VRKKADNCGDVTTGGGARSETPLVINPPVTSLDRRPAGVRLAQGGVGKPLAQHLPDRTSDVSLLALILVLYIIRY
jgi:hypothetical protein